MGNDSKADEYPLNSFHSDGSKYDTFQQISSIEN